MLNKDDLLDLIVHVEYWHPKGTCTTVCCLIFQSGFTELGWSQCADLEGIDLSEMEE